MKKFWLKGLVLAVTAIFLVSCGGQEIRKSAPSFTPYQLNADKYLPKVDNFVLITDTSYSMTEMFGAKKKWDINKEFMVALNQTIPELGYKAEMLTFDRVVYPLAPYSTAGFCKAIGAPVTLEGNSEMPLAQAINQAAQDLAAASGKTALLIVSDGKKMGQAPVNAAAAMKKQLGDRLCIYTVQIGDDPTGAKVLQQLASAGGCGTATTVAALSNSGKLGAFVESVFLAPKPAPKAMPVDSDGDGVPDSQDRCPNTPKGATVDARGCWTYKARVLFDFDSTEIKPEAYPMLDEAAKIMKENPDLKVEIDGHTDNVGPAAYNMKLSEKRAQAVRQYFIDHGVPASQLTAKGFGLTQPVADNSTKEGRAQNRRVELKPVK